MTDFTHSRPQPARPSSKEASERGPWKLYTRPGVTEMRPIVPFEDMVGIAVSDAYDASCLQDGMVARDLQNPFDQWYVGPSHFERNFIEVAPHGQAEKALDVHDEASARTKINDIRTAGDPFGWVTICKAWSESQGWMKSTKAYETPNGCLVQVSTQQRNADGSYSVAEALTFVPGVHLSTGPGGEPVIGL